MQNNPDQFHKQAVQTFEQSPGNGLVRMPFVLRKIQPQPLVTFSTAEVQTNSPFADNETLLQAKEAFENLFHKTAANPEKATNPLTATGSIRQLSLPTETVAQDQAQLIRHTWRVQSLHLVGLLEHDSPVVHASSETNGTHQVQKPDDFERVAIDKLRNGETLYVAVKGDTLRMLGPLLATRDCTQCHAAREGDLLGALSYTLRKEK